MASRLRELVLAPGPGPRRQLELRGQGDHDTGESRAIAEQALVLLSGRTAVQEIGSGAYDAMMQALRQLGRGRFTV